MKNSKVVFAGRVLIDLTTDTVTAENLLEGMTAHSKSGEKITGTMKKMTVTDDGAGNVTITGSAVVVS